MATAADYLRMYRDQTGVDAVAAIESVVEFVSVYGMTETALDVLCEVIDEEGTTRDFANHLEADGLMTDGFDVDSDIGLEEEEPE
jgi:hypothetical protein